MYACIVHVLELFSAVLDTLFSHLQQVSFWVASPSLPLRIYGRNGKVSGIVHVHIINLTSLCILLTSSLCLLLVLAVEYVELFVLTTFTSYVALLRY